MSIFAKSLPERLSSYLINLGNLMITYNRKGFFAQAKALKQRMDRYTESVAITIRLREEAQTQQTARAEQTAMVIKVLDFAERPLLRNLTKP